MKKKQRLIDKNNCIKFLCEVNEPLFETENYIALFNQIVLDIKNEPEISAIPIDWIRKEQNRLIKSNDVDNIKRAEWLNGMVYRWRKDNE